MSSNQMQDAYSPDDFEFYLVGGLLMSTLGVVGGLFINDVGLMFGGVLGGAFSLIMLAHERWMHHQDGIAGSDSE